MLEDGLYIFRCTVLNDSGLTVNDTCLNWKDYHHRLNKDRAVRVRVRGGVVYFLAHDSLRYYERHHSEYQNCKYITCISQLQQGLLPYPERS